jgi:hypothetical protein
MTRSNLNSDTAPEALRPRIDVSSSEELKRWAQEFGATQSEIVAAVATFGSAADAVKLGLDHIRLHNLGGDDHAAS